MTIVGKSSISFFDESNEEQDNSCADEEKNGTL